MKSILKKSLVLACVVIFIGVVALHFNKEAKDEPEFYLSNISIIK